MFRSGHMLRMANKLIRPNLITKPLQRGVLSTCGSLPPITVSVTGSSGQIAYSLLFRLVR
jgi:hypothetical protein